MAEKSVKDRVYAAAEQISAERNPTVSSVRQAAGVSSADATRFLKEWREEKAAAGTQIAATPQTVLEHAARLAGAVWAEAVKLADDRHAGLEAQWARERQEKDHELAELGADLDRTAAEKDAAIAELTSQLQAATARIEGAEKNAAEALQAADVARAEATRSTIALSGAEARAETLQQALDALLQRVTPETQEPPASDIQD